MTKSIIFIFSLIISLSVFSQSGRNDSIKKVNLGISHYYEQNGHTLTYGKMTTLMKGNVEATNYLNKAKTLNALSIIPGVGGGFCVAYPIAKALSGQQANWTQFAIGCGLIAVYIPIVISTNKNVKKAVDSYNKNKVVSDNTGNNYDLRLGLSQNGLGLTLRF
jgi:hypothetical protein